MNNNQVKLKHIIILISALVIIPSLLVSNQRNIEVYFDENNANEVNNFQSPRVSSVYYKNTTGGALDVYLSGNYAYMVDYGSGLAVIDISDPTNPGSPVDEVLNGFAYDVYVSGDYVFMANGWPGLAIIDITHPTNPRTPIYKMTTGFARDVYVSGDYAYVADYESGLVVIQVRKRVDMEDPIISNGDDNAAKISFGNYYLIFLVIGIISLVIVQKRRKLQINKFKT